ncbi:protein tyrosine kinase [Ancylostoma ceylanicum]|uniref:Protein tyrosine kinase n=1 Tax=Ancylostoma ceylanicum TaxID=53326 RepID=A0A0D6M5W4_9BILA|nr:protein tyrosine kinase [Ancylostoma ceylanicum]
MNGGEKPIRRTSNVISVLIDTNQIRNIVVYHRGGKWYLEESLKFDSAALLFAHYMNKPLLLDKIPVLLQRGVNLCRWEFFHRNVKIMKTVGRGAYGEVKMAELHKRNGETSIVAVKTLSQETGLTISPKLIKEILKEARIMRRLRHPNIVTFVGVVLVDHPLYIILEYVQGGALDSYLRKNKHKIKEDERLQLALGVAWGMEYLHKVNVLHRDIAARNCLYDRRFTVKISDFGLSRKGTTYKMKTMQKMPIKYMAPESLSQFLFSQKSDVYSYGSLLNPQLFANDFNVSMKGTVPKFLSIVGGKLNKMPDNVPPDLSAFVIDKMWCKNPAARTDFHETIDGSRIMEKKSKKKKSPIVVEKMPDLNNIELNTPKPVYGPMAELAEEGKIIQEEKKTTT